MGTVFVNGGVESEFNRWLKKVKPFPVQRERLSIEEALKAHFLIVDSFIEQNVGLGGIGPKSLELLESALGRQNSSFSGKDLFPDIFHKAATILHGITKNHPFHDANKRTAFLCSLHYLKKNGYIPTLEDKQYEDFVVRIADDGIKKLQKFKEFSDLDHPELYFIADYLKKTTREIDKKDFIITYRELEVILRRFGFYLTTPDRNFIKVRRIVDDKYICEVGCPSRNKQVGKGALKTIRKETALDALHDVDSQMFFRNEETLSMLLAKYHEPLRRLADR